MSAPGSDPASPLLHVVRGTPDDVELAAVTAVVAALAAAPTQHEPVTERSAWTAGSRVRRPLPMRGATSWRDSGRPT